MDAIYGQILKQAEELKEAMEAKILQASEMIAKIEDEKTKCFMSEALKEAQAGNLDFNSFIEAYKKQCQK